MDRRDEIEAGINRCAEELDTGDKQCRALFLALKMVLYDNVGTHETIGGNILIELTPQGFDAAYEILCAVARRRDYHENADT